MAKEKREVKEKIARIEVTKDKLTDRGGLILFARYLSKLGIYSSLERSFGSIRKSKKGQRIENIFKQLLCFFFDGTSFSLTRFDELAEDEGYRGVIENRRKEMCSSHAIKRFFSSFSYVQIWLFRGLLQELFIWRLKLTKPKVIMLGLDTMVMDNNDAHKREGVEPTYKKVKGFQPLQLSWGAYIVDAVFRGGSKHSNHGETVVNMVRHIVRKIRKRYSETVPILLREDAGFFDGGNFKEFDEMAIGYISGGKMYDDIKEYVAGWDKESWGRYENEEQVWEYIEFGNRRGVWDRFLRAIYCKPVYEEKQQLLEFARPETILYSNLGVNQKVTESFIQAGAEEYLQAEKMIEVYHGRGRDELVHRALKDFGTEQLPFKRFTANAAFYYTMLVAFFLHEAFKEDVSAPVLKVSSYATTVRRVLIDIAGKIVRTGGEVVLKVTEVTWKRLDIGELWERCNAPPTLA